MGQNTVHVVEDNGGSLEAIAKKYNVGFLALLQANPGVDPYVPRPGSVLTIPLQTLLPDAPREGIVINLAELRLYYYQPGTNSVTVYPIGIGQLGGDTLTPTMVTTISDKRANPTRRRRQISARDTKQTELTCLPLYLPVRITQWAIMQFA